MRRRITISATVLALTLLLAIANVGSAASPSLGREAAARRAAQQPLAAAAPNDVFAINDGFVTKTYNHLGNPANGILTAETWGETGWIEDAGGGAVPNNSQGVVRALKQSKVLRVAVRVELWGADGPGTEQARQLQHRELRHRGIGPGENPGGRREDRAVPAVDAGVRDDPLERQPAVRPEL